MKCSMKGLFVVLAIVFSLVVVQGVWAGSITGFVTGISVDPYMITLDEQVDIYGVNVENLCSKRELCISVDDEITVEYITRDKDGWEQFRACSISVGDISSEPFELNHSFCD